MKESGSKTLSAETLIAGTDQEGVLWGTGAAKRIVEAISEDADSGALTPAEAMYLIERVWARTGR
jgi:hypothetical protein